MRFHRPHLFLLLTPSAFIPFACVNSTNNPPPDVFDGGRYEAGPTPDTSIPDVNVDDQAQPDVADATPTTASVTVVKGGGPEPGVTVVFQSAAGAVVEAKTTGADGKATRAVDPGGMITVLMGGPGARELLTFVGVKNGDDLKAFDAVPVPGALGSFSVDVAGAGTPPAGTTQYIAHAGNCASLAGQPPIAVSLYGDCATNGKAPVLVDAFDRNGVDLGFAYKKGNALATDGGAASVTGLGPWSVTFGNLNVAVTNAPAAATSSQAHNLELLDEVPYVTSVGFTFTGGAANAQLRTLPGYADAFQTQVTARYASTGALASFGFIAKRAAPAASGATIPFDLSQLLPALSAGAVDTTAIAQPKVTWTSAAALTAAVGGYVRVEWFQRPVDGGVTENNGWSFIVPASAADVQAPQLPPSSAWAPATGAGFQPPIIVFVASDLVPTYDDLRAKYYGGLGFAKFSTANYVAPPIAVPGTLRATALSPLPL